LVRLVTPFANMRQKAGKVRKLGQKLLSYVSTRMSVHGCGKDEALRRKVGQVTESGSATETN